MIATVTAEKWMCGCVNGQNVISKSAPTAKDAAGHTEAVKKKNNVSENWTKLVKILVVV